MSEKTFPFLKFHRALPQEVPVAIRVLGQAPDRCIGHGEAMLLGREVEAVGCQRVDGAHVHQERALLGMSEYAIGTRAHGLYLY